MGNRPATWNAPKGKVFVCLACGRNGPKVDEIGDESCFMNAGIVTAVNGPVDTEW